MGGAIAGAVVALLFAPEKGETIRKAIKDKAAEGYKAAKDKAAEGYKAAKEKATEGYNAAKESVNKV